MKNAILTCLLAAGLSWGVGIEGSTLWAHLVRPGVLEATEVPRNARIVRLRIEGMTCGGCAISARIVLERLDGVEDARVDFDARVAIVRYDPDKVTPKRMIDALAETLSYTARVVEAVP